jgi:hypothetical protein
MAQATYRSWVGVAKDTVNASLQINHASGATTLTLRSITGATGTLTTSGATYSAVVVDGVNTETVACSGNISGTADGSTIAVAALANAHNANCYVYFQLTASIGPTAYIPLTSFDFADDYKQLYDSAYRGSNVKNYQAAQGLRLAMVTLAGDLFADTFGYLLGSFFGAYDYTATGGGNPTTYAFSVANTNTPGLILGQPPNYLFYQYNPGNSNTRVFAGARVEEIQLKADPGAFVSHTTKVQAYASGVVANPATIPPVFSSFTAVPARVGTVSIGGTATPKVETYEITLKREEFEMIPTLLGIQDPLMPFTGPAVASAKSTLVVDDDVQLLNYINASQPSFLITLNQGSGTAANGVKIQNTKANYEQVKVIQHGKAHVILEVPFTALANTTDKSTQGGGQSPALVTLSTGVTTGASLY